MQVQLVRRGGVWLRVADPAWEDPLDHSYAQANGGRWNPPGEFGMVYLCADARTARANVARLYAGLPYGPEDLDESDAPQLCIVEVPEGDYVDCESEPGLEAAELPSSYPHGQDGDLVGWERCRPVGRHAFENRLDGVAARSAAGDASANDRELARIRYEDNQEPLKLSGRRPFLTWFWAEEAGA